MNGGENRRQILLSLLLTLWLLFTGGCGKLTQTPVQSRLDEPFPEKLSEWHLFVGQAPHLQPNRRVLPYDLNTPLFSDYASKYRFVWMPPGTSAQYREDGPFDFPVGTILVKSFGFPVNVSSGPERLIETRLLVHTNKGWVGLPYIWNAKQTEATLELVPDPVAIRYTDSGGVKHEFTYFIPNANECKQCHDNLRTMLPIGPKARNLNKNYGYPEGVNNQISEWAKVGYLRGAPPLQAIPKVARWDDPDLAGKGSTTGGTGYTEESRRSLETRARAYLDNNCGHCHQPGGTAGYTGIDLRVTNVGMQALGICKSPNSAGRVGTLVYDLVPGKPDESILLARMESTRPKEMMPQIGRSVVHAEGVALVREWIKSLPQDRAACSAKTTPSGKR